MQNCSMIPNKIREHSNLSYAYIVKQLSVLQEAVEIHV